MKKKKATILAVTAAVLLGTGLYQGLAVRRYEVRTGRLASPIRIALLTDLHSCRYGEGQRELLDAVAAEEPDLVLLGGDFFEDRMPEANAVALLEGLRGKYPLYYVSGNHEYRNEAARFQAQMAALARCGVKRLAGTRETITIGGDTIDLCGVDDPDAYLLSSALPEENDLSFWQQLDAVEPTPAHEHFTVLLSHRPEYFPLYARHGFDLVLCGHAHGGQWRIPGVLNGVYAPGQGFLPRYAGGEYREGGSTMIVSRGLARYNNVIPRVFNRPELVIVDLV